MKIMLQAEVNSAVFISFMIEKIISMQLAACHWCMQLAALIS